MKFKNVPSLSSYNIVRMFNNNVIMARDLNHVLKIFLRFFENILPLLICNIVAMFYREMFCLSVNLLIYIKKKGTLFKILINITLIFLDDNIIVNSKDFHDIPHRFH